MATERTTLIPIISDLGTRDPGVAEFKAAVMEVNSKVRFLDVTHEIRPRDLLEAAFTVSRIFQQFPTRTVFAVLVEQLVAAPARPLLVVSTDYYYFAPDNGVLSFVYQRDAVTQVYHVTAEHYIRTPPRPLSAHLDTYGAAVGWLSKGIESHNFGEVVEDHVRLNVPQAARKDNTLQGSVLHVTRHGGLVTSVHQDVINAVRQEVGTDKPFQAVLGDKRIPVVGGWAPGAPDEVAVYGSAGYLEIVSAKGDAAKSLGAQRGTPVSVVFAG